MSKSHIDFNKAERHPATAHLFIVNPLKGRNLIKLFSTHPPTEEHVKRLNTMMMRRKSVRL